MDLTSIIITLLGLTVILIIVFYVFSMYNRLFRLRNSSSATLGQIQVALKKRLDVIEQLLDAVKSYAQFERDTFETITNLRTAVFTGDVREIRDIDQQSRRILDGITAVAENHPSLRTSEPVGNLMIAVKDLEGEIARHRYTYNNIIQEYNIMLDTIPSKYVASSLGMAKIEYLEFEEDIEQRPSTGFQINHE
jgi:LemA protein